jgi:hypothetical protein
MEFVSIRDFNSSPGKNRDLLARDGKLVITNNGKPSMLVLDIAGKDFEGILDVLRRAEGIKLLEEIQMQSVRDGLDKITMKEIDKEIHSYRKKRLLNVRRP